MKKHVLPGMVLVAVAALMISDTCIAESKHHALTKISKGKERHRLYTNPDLTSNGGIKGTIVKPDIPIEQVLAIPPDEPKLVYEAAVGGKSFEFNNLPMRKYDLIVVYKEKFYEGLQLHRGDKTLNAKDKQSIKTIIDKSEPYFKKKIIHRVEGTTGRGNLARAICTFLRAEGSSNSKQMRRTFKLVMLKQVANLRTGMPGWQVVRTRDLFPVYTDKKHVTIPHNFTKSLSKIRVSDSVKDMGEIDLTK